MTDSTIATTTRWGAVKVSVEGAAARMQQSSPESAAGAEGQQECSLEAAAEASDIKQEHEPTKRASVAASTTFILIP